jgi:site-specific recombinase XerD
MTIRETVEQFLEAHSNEWSPHTKRAYRTALSRFLDYLAGVEHVPSDSSTLLLAGDLDIPLRYADAMAASSGLGESTYCLYLTVLRRWYAYLFEVDVLGPVSAADFQRMQTRLGSARRVSLKSTSLHQETERETPPEDLIERFLWVTRRETPKRRPDGDERDVRWAELRRLRNVALLETLRSTGARIGEALGLNAGDLKLDDMAAVIRREVGKGDKQRPIFFDERSWFALRTYVAETGVLNAADSPVFLQHGRKAGDKTKRLGAAGAQAELRRLRTLLIRDIRAEVIALLLPGCTEGDAQRLLAAFDSTPTTGGLPAELCEAQRSHLELGERVDLLKMQLRQAEKITAHGFRHALASKILEKTGDLAATQDILGHADPRTTRRYAKLSSTRLRQVHRQALEQ